MRTYGGIGRPDILELSSGEILISGETEYYDNGGSDIWLLGIPPDQYAYQDSLFSYSIAPPKIDSSSYGCSVLNGPEGMEVSMGGTVTWTPQTDSVYGTTPEILIVDDHGNKDTVSFVLWVNVTGDDYPEIPHKHISGRPGILQATPVTHEIIQKPSQNPIQISSHASIGSIKISLPSKVSSVEIFDIRGRIINRLNTTGKNQIIWNGHDMSGNRVSAGKYFLRIKTDRAEVVRPVLMMR